MSRPVDLYTAYTDAMQALDRYPAADEFERASIEAAKMALDALRLALLHREEGTAPKADMKGWADTRLMLSPEAVEGLRIWESANFGPEGELSLPQLVYRAIGFTLREHNCLIPPKE